MSILGSAPGGMDQAAEIKATLMLQGNQLGLLGLKSPTIGQVVEVCAKLRVQAVTAYENEKGVPDPAVSFVVESIMQDAEEDPMNQIRSMFPSMKVVS